MRSVSGVGRVAALGAVIAAVALVAILLFGGGGGGSYSVTARFQNAGQIVKGNPVQTGGVPIGSVEKISITDDGQAEIRLKIDGDHAPLRRGGGGAIRPFSPSGDGECYIDFEMPADGGGGVAGGGGVGG